jgi:hypothetical protein
MLQPSSNLNWGLASADGYVNLVPKHLASVWGEPAHEPGLVRRTFTVKHGRLEVFPGLIRMARLWNVRYLVSLWPTSHPDLEPLRLADTVFAYRVKDVLPRAFVVSDFVLAADDDEAQRLLLAEGHDYRRKVILHQPPAVAVPRDEAEGQAEIEIDTAHEVRLRVDTTGSAFLVLADTFYPGWRVEVDGRPAVIQRANIMQRAVLLGPGRHVVRFYFRSVPVLLGAGITALSALAFGPLLVAARRARAAADR